MMDTKELIPIENKNGKQAVNARLLHDFLGSNRDFSNWIKDRIVKCDLVENEDFEVFTKFGENPNGGRPSKEYALSIDAAKEISMMEGNEKGKIARRYFIECEKKLKQMTCQLPKDYPSALRALADTFEKKMKLEEENKRQQLKIEEDKPKVTLAESYLERKDCDVTINMLAKMISQKEGAPKLGANQLLKVLRYFGYLILQGTRRNTPTQKYMDMGLFRIIQQDFETPNGYLGQHTIVYVTPKGAEHILKMLYKWRDEHKLSKALDWRGGKRG